ncbi:MAG: sulfite exporter TauE/SafE family protein [Gammaproteobacteria bacterium]|nr:sulfite exporter TauE/SafE family protein [Gammaproteobacteria bacterium]
MSHLAEIGPWLPVFFLAALLYSSVGHGGASAYLALLVLSGLARPETVPLVLVLNIAVALIAFVNYHRAGHFSLRLLWPFAATSVPAAFIGGSLNISMQLFSVILGLALLAAALRFLFFASPRQAHITYLPHRLLIALPAGAILGLLAGLVGIGGGVFLSPLLLLLGWADTKRTGAVTAGFIVLNSASGLTAQTLNNTPDWGLFWPLLVTVLAGAAIGSWWGAFKLSTTRLQQVLGVVLLAAGVKLLVSHL